MGRLVGIREPGRCYFAQIVRDVWGFVMGNCSDSLKRNLTGTPSQFFVIGVFTGTMLWLRFGLGRHEVVVEEEDPMNIVRFYQTIFANEIMYPLSLSSARLSLVVLYHRIFGLFNARYWLYGLQAFIVAWAIYAVRRISATPRSPPGWRGNLWVIDWNWQLLRRTRMRVVLLTQARRCR